MFDPAQGEASARAALANPDTTPEELTAIAQAFPALAAQVVTHPGGPKKSRTGLVIGRVAGAMALVLGLGTGWFFLHDGGSSTIALAPDFTEEPKLGTKVVVKDVMKESGDDLSWTGIIDFMDSTHVVVWGAAYDPYDTSTRTEWYDGYDEEYEAGYNDGTSYKEAYDAYMTARDEMFAAHNEAYAAWLACTSEPCPERPKDLTTQDYPDWPDMSDYRNGSFADHGYSDGWHDAEYGDYGDKRAEPDPLTFMVGLLDMESKDLDWQLDLSKESGFHAPKVPTLGSLGNGSLVLGVSDRASGDKVILAVASDGTVTSDRHDVDLVEGVNGYAVIRDGNTVIVTKGSDFENEVWSAGSFLHYSVDVLQDGDTFYVLTDDGYVEGSTGEVKGFGKDVDHDVRYNFLTGGVLLRCEGTPATRPDYYYSAMRIDPDDGKEMWDTAIKDTYCTKASYANGMLLFFGADDTFHGVQASDGEEKWDAKGHKVYALNSGYVLITKGDDNGGALIDPKSGDALSTFKDMEQFAFVSPSGKKVFYTWDDNELKAWSATGDSDSALWSLSLGGGNDILTLGGRMFVTGKDATDDDSGPRDVWLQEVVKS